MPARYSPQSDLPLSLPDLVHLDMSIEDGKKLVHSGGLVGPPQPALVGTREPRSQPPVGDQPQRAPIPAG